MKNNKLWFLVSALGVVMAVGFAFSAAHAQMPQGNFGQPGQQGGGFGQGNPAGGPNSARHNMKMPFSGVTGTVTAVNGMTISVQSSRASSTIYAVDASNATVRKNNATSTVSAIAVGDRVLVRGTVNGTSVTAASIIDGNFGRGFAGNGNPFNASSSANGMPFGRGRGGRPFGAVSGTMPFVSGTFPFASGTSPFASGTPPFGRFGGLGGESITGTVASVGNSTLTVTGNNGTTYTVDISSATLVKQGNATSSVSAINVGDSVQIQGNVSGTSVTANIIVDNVSQSSSNRGFFGTIEGAIGNLFSKLFHFNFRF